MNLLALPFYAALTSQLQHGRCGNIATGLLAPRDRFLPFVLKRPATGQGLDCVKVIAAHTGQLVLMIMPADFPCLVYTDTLFDYYVYFGNIITGLNLACGQYYLEVKGFYSEVFEVRTDLTQLLKIEWTNSSDIEQIPYSAGFIQRLYLDSGLAEPTYKHEEDGEDDGDKVFVPLAHRLLKSFKFDTVAIPEALLDVLTSLAIHDTVTIGSKSQIHELEVSPTWSKDSCAAIASVTFSERPVLASVCATTLPLTLLDTSAYTPKPWLCGDNSDVTPFWENTGETRCVQGNAVFSSAAITQEVTRDGCPAGTTPGTAFYTVPAGHVIDTTSQTDVDTRALAYFNSTKQAYANSHAQCINNATVGITRAELYGSNDTFVIEVGRSDTNGDLEVNIDVLLDGVQTTVSITILAGQTTESGTYGTPSGQVASAISAIISSTTPNTYTF